jgi:hypothetical protein
MTARLESSATLSTTPNTLEILLFIDLKMFSLKGILRPCKQKHTLPSLLLFTETR